MSWTTGRAFLTLTIISSAAVQYMATSAHGIEIPTNFGMGADAEVREDPDNHMRANTDAAWGPLGAPRGRNRGADGELATRIRDLTENPNNDRTSAMYLKFDISGITQNDLIANNQAKLRLTVRNTNLNWSRIYALNPYYGSLPADDTNPEFVAFRDNIANYTRIQFNLFGLKPEPLDLADPRRFGDADPTLPVPNYNWIEAPAGDPNNVATDETTWDTVKSPVIGPIGPLTWYNAPGITPDSRTTPLQDAGKFNFNSDLELLGTFTLPDPPGLSGPPTADGSARLPVGQAVIFDDPSGNLHNLIQRALDNGRDTVTLAVAHALNGLVNTSPETLQTTPGSMLNFNYLVNPKEVDSDDMMAGRQLVNDTGWDPDGGGPLTPTGSPYSCFNHANCGPNPVGLGDNTNGAFSPTLILVPEPGTAALVGLGLIIAMGIRRRQ